MSALLNVILPVFGIILCGYLAARFKVLGPQSSEALNAFVYYFALPAILFIFVARAPVERIFYWPFLAAWGGGLFITFLIMALISRFYYRDRLAVLTLRAMNGVFANTGYMGIPLVMAAFGDAAALPAIMATVFLSVVGISALVTLVEIDLRREGSAKSIARDVAVSLARNPLILPVLLAVNVPLFGLELPASLAFFFDLLGNAAGPCALFALGMFAAGQSLRAGIAETGVITFVKLIVHPLVTWLLATRVFEMDYLWTVVTVIMASLPTGASCFVFAQRYQIFVARTSSATLATTALSVVTVSLLIAMTDTVIPAT
ncbi:MAG: AEC family transporter [Gammaproteobacteria bacterium]|nr:AEC family transporter [Gammaproteobacteria bacterium]